MNSTVVIVLLKIMFSTMYAFEGIQNKILLKFEINRLNYNTGKTYIYFKYPIYTYIVGIIINKVFNSHK